MDQTKRHSLSTVARESLIPSQAVDFSFVWWVLLGYFFGKLLGSRGGCDINKWMFHASHNDMNRTKFVELSTYETPYCLLYCPCFLANCSSEMVANCFVSLCIGSPGCFSSCPQGSRMIFSPSITLCCLLYCPGFLTECDSEKGMVYSQYLVSTFTVKGGISTGQSYLDYVFWWLFMLDPAEPFGVMASFWAQLELCCWLISNLYNWLLHKILSFSLIDDIMWNSFSEILLWTVICVCFLCLSPVSVGHVNSKVPGYDARISVAPSFREQPDSGTPRCSYAWLSGSMIRTVNSETPQIFLLLHFRCFKSKALSGVVVFFLNDSFSKANSGLMMQRNKVWFYELERQCAEYIMDVNYRSIDKNGADAMHFFHQNLNQCRTEQFVVTHWIPSQLFQLYLNVIFFMLNDLLVASEDIRCQPYISSKALYQTAFGPRTNFFCFPLNATGLEPR